MSRQFYPNRILALMCAVILAITLCACNDGPEETEVEISKVGSTENRSNEPKCLTPLAGGKEILGGGELTVDASNSDEGYLYVSNTGEVDDVKIQLSCDDSVTYTYIIPDGDSVIPLSLGDGTYSVIAYEGMGEEGMYATKFAEDIDVVMPDPYLPFLYPNCYVQFDINSDVVALGKDLAEGKATDIEVIAAVYDYVIKNITYDHERAATVKPSYVPSVDQVLKEKKGICFDYAALMAAMLRSQRIPTKLEFGYAGDAYHAWVTTYIEDEGWINGIIEFDGVDWTLMDPTFAANAGTKKIKSFIGDGNNYTTKYTY
ncbi:MAG: transglutaminase domain-containing protein [Lachnospiraceae bacterium]|nr:transglutaminase domain-containing protein [Lachnospiraceae bacterium]MBQ8666592.1 transglutaminase domain-containing protein [Lachnospiraceae bacterium]